jgi:hypothetical protein
MAIAVAAFIPFVPAITAGFIHFDDNVILVEIDGYRGLDASHLRWMFTTTHMGHYQPLTWLSYAVEYSIWGLNPIAFHLTNMVVHSVNAALVFLVARRLIRTGFPDGASPVAKPPSENATLLGAAAAALLFAVHPMRVESVAWITERRDVLSTFFLLTAALAYLRAFPPQSVRPRSTAWYAASVVLLLVSLLCKAWGMTFFVVLLVLDWFPLRRLEGPPWRWLKGPGLQVLLQKTPYAILGVSAAVMAKYATGSVPYTTVGLRQWGVVQRVVQAAYGLAFYLEKTVWPAGLAALYELPRGQSLLQGRFVAAIIFTGAGAAVAFALRRRLPAVTAAAIVYAVVLSPVLGVNQSGPQFVADRYSYVANIPWAVLLGAGLTLWASRRATRGPLWPGIAAGAAVLVALGALTWRQTGFWRDTLVLFNHGISVGADGPIIRVMYGRELSERGRKQDAAVQLERATELEPHLGEAWFALGTIYKDLGRLGDSERAYATARQNMPDPWRADIMLGILYTKIDRPRDAAARFRAAVAEVEAPTNEVFSARPYLLLGTALGILGEDAEARQWLQKAAQYDETRAEALDHLRDLDAEGAGK